MTRLLPFPLVSTGLLVVWLLLNQTLSLGHVLLGSAAALIGGLGLAALRPPKARIRRPAAIFRLALLVVIDIIRSNISVGRIVLGLAKGGRTSGFVKIPLELRDSYALAALACIITATPGTLWVSFDSVRGMLLIHVLDLTDGSEWIQTIKGRYERHLLEIFE
jgi:multicomponent K+:H+ antiporter subunit E